MSGYQGDYPAGAVVRLDFTTTAGTGGPIAPSSAFEAADILIFKDSSPTQRSSTAGVTMSSPFSSIVGLHLVAIDLDDDTDVGFFAPGHDYIVILKPDETVDGEAVVAGVASFSIENRHSAVTLDDAALAAIAEAALLLDWTTIEGAVPDRCLLQAARFLRNKWAIADGVLHVKDESDADDAWTGTVAQSASADPVTGIDPS